MVKILIIKSIFLLFSLNTYGLTCSNFFNNSIICSNDEIYFPDSVVGLNSQACKKKLSVADSITVALSLAQVGQKGKFKCEAAVEGSISCGGDIFFPSSDDLVENPCEIVVDDGRSLKQFIKDSRMQDSVNDSLMEALSQ